MDLLDEIVKIVKNDVANEVLIENMTSFLKNTVLGYIYECDELFCRLRWFKLILSQTFQEDWHVYCGGFEGMQYDTVP